VIVEDFATAGCRCRRIALSSGAERGNSGAHNAYLTVADPPLLSRPWHTKELKTSPHSSSSSGSCILKHGASVHRRNFCSVPPNENARSKARCGAIFPFAYLLTVSCFVLLLYISLSHNLTQSTAHSTSSPLSSLQFPRCLPESRRQASRSFLTQRFSSLSSLELLS
jgi:hypothetical protein